MGKMSDEQGDELIMKFKDENSDEVYLSYEKCCSELSELETKWLNLSESA